MEVIRIQLWQPRIQSWQLTIISFEATSFLGGVKIDHQRSPGRMGWCRSVTQGRCLENWGYLGGWVESGAEEIAGSGVPLEPLTLNP